MATQFINLTPHAITIVDTRSDDESNIIRQIPPSGWELRVSEKTENIGEVDRIPLTKKTFGKLEVVKGRNGEGTAPQMDIPDTIYIMSQMAKAALDKAKISDIDFQVDYQNCLYAVPTDMVRDENGGIIGCRSLGV
jgi:hypothetical protein